MASNVQCMPTPPKRVGREFVRQYYTIMNKSPENLHCFYNEEAKFVHDDVNPAERRTITADGKRAIREVMIERLPHFKHTSTKIHTVDTIETLDQGLLVQANGEISYNEQPMRQFCQTFILIPRSPFQYFVQNDIFRFCDFEPYVPEGNPITETTMPSGQQDWGTQCEEEYIESYEERTAQDGEPRVDSDRSDGQQNEVKLDTSDSGLSSDAEKAIMDIQSINLKSILKEPKSITKETVMNRGSTPPAYTENELATEIGAKPTDDANRSQLFRDSCILTIGNVVNPNIEFEHENANEISSLQNGSPHETATDKLNASKSDDISSGKANYRKRKDKRKAKTEMLKEKSLDESMEKVEVNQSLESCAPPGAAVVESATINNIVESMPLEEAVEPIESESTVPPYEEKTPKSIQEQKTYADLAKAGKAEWTDELAMTRRNSTERNQTRPPLVSRSSRAEKTTPPTDAGYNSRSSPKTDLLQVFIGNIPHSATEDGIRGMFSRFGRLTRFRLHSNSRKEWLPRYAFISYDNIQSVKHCLMKKGSFYWPENAHDAQKLNVNGDPAVDIWDDSGNQRAPGEQHIRSLRQFSRNFQLENNKELSNKRSPDLDTNMSDSAKSERRKMSTKA